MNTMKQTDSITILEGEPMSAHTSWRAGGIAKRFVQANSLAALCEFIATLPEDEELVWLGLGSNTLIRDGGFKGTVIATQGVMTQLELIDETTVCVGAGVPGAKLAKFCAKHDLSGAEFYAGIPGLVGGALAMNAGAFGGETWPLVVSVETLNRRGEIKKRDASEYRYGYRSIKNVADMDAVDEWFVSATLKLKKKHLADLTGNSIDIKQLLAKRAATQPTGVASCGSVFRNPEGGYAAQLIQDCGLKGKRIGGAVVSQKHANFIINDDNASAQDIESLVNHVQSEVKQKFGINLQHEVRIYGDAKPSTKRRRSLLDE